MRGLDELTITVDDRFGRGALGPPGRDGWPRVGNGGALEIGVLGRDGVPPAWLGGGRTSFLGALDSFSFSRSLPSVADCVPLVRMLAFLLKVVKKVTGAVTTEPIELLDVGVGGCCRHEPVVCCRSASDGYGRVEGTSAVERSPATGVKSMALCASGRIGNVASDTAELPEARRRWVGPTGTGPSGVSTVGPVDIIIGLYGDLEQNDLLVLLKTESIQSDRPQSSVANSLIFIA